MDVTVGIFAGGAEVSKDIEALSKGIQIAVGTPGRLVHMIESNKLKTHTIKMVIIDEADEMLTRGFAE